MIATINGRIDFPASISPAKLIPPVISKKDATNTNNNGEIDGNTSFTDSKTIMLTVVKKITVVPISNNI